MKKKHLLLLMMFAWSGFAFGQSEVEELLESIEVRAYIQQDQLPQFTPTDCPTLEERTEDDVLALRVLSTLMYELIHFWGDEFIAGAESGLDTDDVVYWRIVQSKDGDFEVILKTENIRLGKLVYQHLETQQAQTCFNWGLVFSNEEVVVLEEDNTEEIVINDDFDTPSSYERYDPYNDAYTFSEFAVEENPMATDDLAISDFPTSTTSYEYGTDMQTTELNSYSDVPATNPSRTAAFSTMMPAPSDEVTLPPDFFSGMETLGEVERKLANTLEAKGFVNKGYFEFDNGFMIATQMEAMNSSGTSKAAQYRFPSRIVFNQSLSFQNYMNSLFLPERSSYRMFVFYVEAAPNRAFTDIDEIDYSVANRSNIADGNRSPLPESIARLPYRHKSNFDSNVKVLVYESQTGPNDRRPSLLANSSLSGREHLVRSGLWNWLQER